MSYTAFGRGHVALDGTHALGRTAIHEVGHWLNLRHIWGDDNGACTGSDLVSDTPNQSDYYQGVPLFPSISCGNGPNGDMFMNHMDYVDDDSKLMFSTGQALRMQAIIASSTPGVPGGYRESLRNSPGLCPTLSIASMGIIPRVVTCGDRTDYKFRVNPLSVGCGGGSIQYQWAATGAGWTVTYPNQFYPQIIPSGNSSSVITLTGTYTNFNGATFQLNTASVVVNYNPLSATPIFTGDDAMRCSGTATTFTVGAVAGALSSINYRWTVPAGFTPTGQVSTTTPSLPITPNAGLAGGTYSVQCQAQVSGCPISTTATRSFNVNGGPLLRIVDGDPTQNYRGLVCSQNRISLVLVPVSAATNVSATSITWSPGLFATVPSQYFPLETTYYTPNNGGTTFTVTARYTDGCGNIRNAVPYTATTASMVGTSLGNGYSCLPNRYRPVPSAPYPNPATGSLQLPGYRGEVVVYNQQGKPVHTLLAPGTDYGVAVDTSAWPDGLYVVTGRNLMGQLLRHNVQVQH